MQNDEQDLNKKSKEYAQRFIDLFGKMYKGLDYSENSLKVVDKILESEMVKQIHEGPERIRDGLKLAIAGYVTEVITRNLNGKLKQNKSGQLVIVLHTAKGKEMEVIHPFLRLEKYFKNRAETMSWFYEMTKKTVESN